MGIGGYRWVSGGIGQGAPKLSDAVLLSVLKKYNRRQGFPALARKRVAGQLVDEGYRGGTSKHFIILRAAHEGPRQLARLTKCRISRHLVLIECRFLQDTV